MTAPPKKHPDVTKLADRFAAYLLDRAGGWGLGLYWALDKHPECPEHVRVDAEREYDAEGIALYEIACELTESQRNKLYGLIWKIEREKRAGRART